MNDGGEFHTNVFTEKYCIFAVRSLIWYSRANITSEPHADMMTRLNPNNLVKVETITMRSYNIEAPVIVEFVSPLDRHDSSMDRTPNLCALLTLDDVECHMKLGERNCFTLHGIKASSENNAFASAAILLNKLCIAATVASEIPNQNPHCGYLRLSWDAKGLKITPRDHSILGISESSDLTFIPNIRVEFLAAITEAISRVGDVSLIFDAYYRAMGPQDPRTSYAVGFFVIELIESRFKSKITTHLLLPNDNDLVCSILDHAKTLLESETLPESHCLQETIDRVASRIRNNLKGATIENRVEKLTAILHDVFQITEINTGVKKLQVESKLVKRLIDARNKLFHGSATSANADDYRELTLMLMSIIGQILEAVVEGRVQWEEIE